MCVGSPTAGISSSFRLPPDKDFETTAHERPLEPFKFTQVHVGVAQVADVVGGDELVENAGKARIGERYPTPDHAFILVGLHAGFLVNNSGSLPAVITTGKRPIRKVSVRSVLRARTERRG